MPTVAYLHDFFVGAIASKKSRLKGIIYDNTMKTILGA